MIKKGIGETLFHFRISFNQTFINLSLLSDNYL